MLDAREIKKEIARLEYEESSYPNYAKLAHLYVIRNQMERETRPDTGYSFAAAPASEPERDYMPTVSIEPTSEFLAAVNGKDSQMAWAVMDELMDTLKVVNSRVYNRIMEKLNTI